MGVQNVVRSLGYATATRKSTTPMRPVKVVVARVERGVPWIYGGKEYKRFSGGLSDRGEKRKQLTWLAAANAFPAAFHEQHMP
jgi:hypothetical protein